MKGPMKVRMKGPRKERQESLLDNLYLAAPCPMTWESMEGDDKVRHCKGCAKNVYNISAMTAKEAEEFLRINGDGPCMQFFRRADGTIITDNCPVGLRKLRDRVKKIARVAAGFLAFVVSMPVALAQGGSNGSSTGSSKGSANGTSQRAGASATDSTTGGGKREAPVMLGGKPMMPPIRGRVLAVPQSRPSGINEIKPQGTQGASTVPVGASGANTNGTAGNGDGNRNWIKLQAEHETLADTKAVDFYKKAKAKEEEKNYDLAEFFYEKSLDAVEKQGGCDAKFRSLIESSLTNVRKQKSKCK